MFRDRLHFFMQNPPQDDRTRLAHAFDLLLPLIAVWFITILVLVSLLNYNHVVMNAILALVLAVETALVVKVKIRRKHTLNMHRDIWFSARKCREKISKIESRKDFALLVKDLLENTAKFQNLSINEENKVTDIDLSGYIGNNKVAIMCLNSPQEDFKVTSKQIKKFLWEIKHYQFDKGIVVTSGTFSDNARLFVRRMKGQKKIHMVESHAMLRMAKRVNHPIFPEEKWQEEREDILSGLEMANSIKENIITSKKRSLFFTLLGTIFLVISALQAGFIGLIYLIFGIINIFIGFSGFMLSFLRKNEFILD